MRIYKYPILITVGDKAQTYMHKDAQVISAQVQDGRLMFWAMVDSENAKLELQKELRYFHLIPTGMEFEGVGKFISTVQHAGIVLHIFEDA